MFDPSRGAIDLSPIDEPIAPDLHAALEREATRVAEFARAELLTMSLHMPAAPVVRTRGAALANDLAIEM
jgi:hypothetical protein